MKYNLIDLKNLNNIRSHVVKNKVTAWPHWVGGENTEIGGGGKVRKPKKLNEHRPKEAQTRTYVKVQFVEGKGDVFNVKFEITHVGGHKTEGGLIQT